MNIGDYVRTRDGDIGKTFEKYKGIQGAIIYKIDRPTEDFDYTNVFDFEIIKSSPNVIDLIEVGDYVNGQLVTSAEKVVKNDDRYIGFGNYDYYISKNEDIKSIVTKEMYSGVEYTVESEVN